MKREMTCTNVLCIEDWGRNDIKYVYPVGFKLNLFIQLKSLANNFFRYDYIDNKTNLAQMMNVYFFTI